MSKDIKIEILYYKTKPDVALEFGLHGEEYSMRLLSSCSDSLTAFFTQLKRAVSRSEIILIVGGYSDKDGLIGFLARSIGKKCIIPNYRKAGIITSEKHIIPEGADPIAPKSRLFGGFIIEQGPQTIISLVDDPKIRLDIVNELVVAYITEHYKVFNRHAVSPDLTVDADKVTTSSSESNSIAEETVATVAEAVITDIAEEASEPNAESADTTPAEAEIDVENSEKAELQETDDTELNTSVETEDTVKENSDPSIIIDIDIDLDIEDSELLSTSQKPSVDFDFDETDYASEKHKTRRARRTVRWVTAILSVIIVACLILCMVFNPLSKPADNSSYIVDTDYYSSLQKQYSSYSNDLSTAFDNIKKQDSRVFTWLSLSDADINHPVINTIDVQKSNLLNCLPDGTADARGSLYGNSDTYITGAEHSTVIYGNAGEGGLLSKLTTAELVGKELTSVDSRFMGKWKIFACFTHSSAGDFDYLKSEFESTDEYKEYLHGLAQFSAKPEDLIFYGNEKLVILVGMSSGERYIAVAMLSSIRILSYSTADNSSSEPTTSSDPTSSETDSSAPENTEGDNDFHGNSPDIILPPMPSVPSTSSDVTASGSSSTVSSSKPTPSTSLSSETTTTEISSTEVSNQPPSQLTPGQSSSELPSESSEVSSSVESVASSKPSSSEQTSSETVISSQASSTQPSSSESTSSEASPKPNVDPIYTWDVTLSVKNKANNEVITADAVTIVAMLIEVEMSPTIDPREALIAQAVVKYNWVINNGGLSPTTAPKNAIDTKPTKQAMQYANESKGMVLMYGNALAKTYCYAYSAGYTADYYDIWGGSKYPYLQGVECPVDRELKDFETTTTYTSAQIASLIKTKLKIDVTDMPKSEWLKPIEYDKNNTYCTKISIGGKSLKGTYLRDSLLTGSGVSTIKSSAYTISYDETSDKFIIKTKGYGHGVGLSQRGAKAYAKQGWTAEQILMHFFPGTALVKN